ncbi:asparagine synthase-related protein, partial [Lysobacter sp. 2RAB21]
PVSQWLRGDLHDWAEALLDPRRLRAEGYFDAELVGGLWRSFVDGEKRWHTHLWNVLMFQAWWEQYGLGAASSAFAVLAEPLPAVGPERIARVQYGY